MAERKGRARLSAAIDRLAAAVPYGDLMAATDPAALLETAAKMLSEHPKSWEPPPDDYLDTIEDDDELDDTGKWRAFAFAWGFERRRCSDLREDFDRRLRGLIREAAPIQGSGPDYQPAADDEVFVTVTGVVVSVAPKGAVTVEVDIGYTEDDADVRLLVWPNDVRLVDAMARTQGSGASPEPGPVVEGLARAVAQDTHTLEELAAFLEQADNSLADDMVFDGDVVRSQYLTPMLRILQRHARPKPDEQPHEGSEPLTDDELRELGREFTSDGSEGVVDRGKPDTWPLSCARCHRPATQRDDCGDPWCGCELPRMSGATPEERRHADDQTHDGTEGRWTTAPSADALRRAADIFEREANAARPGEAWDGGPLHGASKYNVNAYAARRLRAWADIREGSEVVGDVG